MQLNQTLQKLGFNKNQIKIYLAALEVEQASAQDIGKQASIPRTTAYSILNSLVERGVVGKTLVRGKTRFIAEPPAKLLSTLKEIETELKKNLPELEARYNKNETKPKIVFYEGKNAVQKVYDDTLVEKPKEILEWNTDAYFDFSQHQVDSQYIAKRMDLNIHAKRLAGSGSKWHTKHKKYDRSELSETRIVPREIFWPEIEVNIYNNKIAFLNYAEQMSIIIESKAIADTMRQVYHLSWVGAEKLEVE